MREALESFQSVVRIAPQGSERLCEAMFALPEPLIEVGVLDDVSAALRRAFDENERKFDGYGGTGNSTFVASIFIRLNARTGTGSCLLPVSPSCDCFLRRILNSCIYFCV